MMPHDVENNAGGLVESEARVEAEKLMSTQYMLNEAEFKRLGIKPTDTYQRQQPGSKEHIAIKAAFHYVKGYAGDTGKSRKDIAKYIIQNKLLGEMKVSAEVQTISRAIDHLEKGAKIRSEDGGQTYTFY